MILAFIALAAAVAIANSLTCAGTAFGGIDPTGVIDAAHGPRIIGHANVVSRRPRARPREALAAVVC